MTYKQAYDKIIDAYFKDQIEPYDKLFCFCGTLANDNEYWWSNQIDGVKLQYSHKEYSRMERALLNALGSIWLGSGNCEAGLREGQPGFEDALFKGMSKALEVLKKIHESRGEVIDPLPTFTKRVFSDVLKMVK